MKLPWVVGNENAEEEWNLAQTRWTSLWVATFQNSRTMQRKWSKICAQEYFFLFLLTQAKVLATLVWSAFSKILATFFQKRNHMMSDDWAWENYPPIWQLSVDCGDILKLKERLRKAPSGGKIIFSLSRLVYLNFTILCRGVNGSSAHQHSFFKINIDVSIKIPPWLSTKGGWCN